MLIFLDLEDAKVVNASLEEVRQTVEIAFEVRLEKSSEIPGKSHFLLGLDRDVLVELANQMPSREQVALVHVFGES